MKKMTALFGFAMLLMLGMLLSGSGPGGSLGSLISVAPTRAWAATPPVAPQEAATPAAPQEAASPAAPQEAKKSPQWKSRDEYDAFQAMATEKDPRKRISLADAFLQKFADSDFKDAAYVTVMGAHQQLGESDKAVDAARKALEANPDNLQALTYLSFVFPFVFKSADADAESKLARADADARHGLEVLQKLTKPEGVTDEQFNQYVKSQRAVLNNAVGFAAMQRKDFSGAITSLAAAAQDAPSDPYTFYRLGVAHVSKDPRDYDNGIWNLARSSALAKAARNAAEPEITKYLRQVYISYHGNDEGLAGITQQAAAAMTPPEGFKVEAMKIPEKTGNPNIDAFNQLALPLRMGGENGQKAWDALKGQPLGLGGFVDSVEKGTEAGVLFVRIDMLDASKAADGLYDIELKDSTQPNAKNLGKGDAVRFQGTIESYAAAPNFILTLHGTIIDPDPLPTEPAVKAKPKPAARPRATTRRPRR